MTLTLDQFHGKLRARIAASTWGDVSRELGVPISTLQRVLWGAAPGSALLTSLGYSRAYVNGKGRPVTALAVGKAARALVAEHGTYQRAADAIGVNIATLHKVAHLVDGEPQPRVLEALGYRLVYVSK